MSDDILAMLAQKEEALLSELEKVRTARVALGGTAAQKARAPKVQMTVDNDNADDASGGSLPAPRRSMSKAARAKLSAQMKARWKKLKAAQK